MGQLIHAVGHGLSADDTIMLGNLVGGDGLEENVLYYVLASGLTADDFKVSETSGGTAITFTTDLTDGTVVLSDTYEVVADGVMDPPTAVPTASSPTISSATISGIVRLVIQLNDTAEAKVRVWEVQVTHQFDSNGDPDWDLAQVFNLPEGTTELSVPALGSTVYNVRVRAIDVYGNEGAFSNEVESTTIAGSDALNAALADLANDVPDGIITETKISDGAISTPKLQAGAVTASVLAATIVLASLVKTATSGRRIEMDIDGIRLLGSSDELLVRIPTNGDPVYVKGEINADTFISQTSAEFRTAASLAGSSVMTLQNGVSTPSVAPSIAASVDSLAFTSTPPNLGYGLGYDGFGGAGGATASYWVGADPGSSDYVAHEYNASTGVLMRSITKTGSFTTYTTTLGSTTHVADSVEATSGGSDSQVATLLTMPRDGRVTKVAVRCAGWSGSATLRNCIWSSGNNQLRFTAEYTAASQALGVGNSALYNKTFGTTLSVSDGQNLRVGFLRVSSSDGFQWDRDDGGGKTTYKGDNLHGDMTGVSTDTSHKPNVYITYEYDVDTTLEGFTGKIVGVARASTYIFVLEDTGILYKYNQADLTYVTKNDLSASISGGAARAGLFYDVTAGELVITTATGTGAGVYPKFIRVNLGTLAAGTTYSAAAGPSFTGSTAVFRGGARLNDPLNASAATYWVPCNGTVYGYTFSGSTATNTANRDFGRTGYNLDGLAHDGTVFRGWAVASPTKVWKFSAWDWTTASAIYWIGYAWYDSAGTTHETVIGPRSSLTMQRRERVQVTTPAIPLGGADDPDKVRIYIKPNATDPGAGNFKLQVTDALTARYLTDYSSGGAADGGGTAFAAGTPAQIASAGTGYTLKGSGLINRTGTAFPASPATGDHYYRSDIGLEFRYDGTRWLSVDQFITKSSAEANTSTWYVDLAATTTSVLRAPFAAQAGTDIYVEKCMFTGFVNSGGTALGASHKWNALFNKVAVDNTATSLGNVDIASGSSSAWRQWIVTVNAVLSGTYATYPTIRLDMTKTGTPGSVNVGGGMTITYRLVQT